MKTTGKAHFPPTHTHPTPIPPVYWGRKMGNGEKREWGREVATTPKAKSPQGEKVPECGVVLGIRRIILVLFP